MKVFLTGATGFVGTCVTTELIAHGHTVSGLARTDASASKLKALGATPVQGSLDDLSTLTAAARDADAVIHAAFVHDFADPNHSMTRNVAMDIAALKALAEGMGGTNKVLINTHGSLVGPEGKTFTESMAKRPGMERNASEDLLKQLAEDGLNVVTIRLPVTVHGEGDPNFVTAMLHFAKQSGYAAYVGDGSQRWPHVHKLDAAVIYRLAIERPLPKGQVLHPIDNELVTVKSLAEVIGKKLGLPVKSLEAEELQKSLGFIGWAMGTDNPLSKEETVRLTGWTTSQIGVLEDVERNY
jgi:nucleoside-diphosphate-sugar epimerase